MKKWKLLVIVTALVLALAGCGSSKTTSTSEGEKQVIKIGYLPITHAATLFVQAQEQYPDYEIELVKFGSWPDLMDALNTGAIDGASVLAQLAMTAKEKGIDLKAVALGHRDGNVLIGGKDINSVADLKGKSYAIPNKFSTHNVLLNEMLTKNGLTIDDVDVVELAPAEMPAALAEGRIAGYVVAEPFGAISVALDKGKVLYNSEEIWPNSICCLLVFRSGFLEDNKDVVKTFVADYTAAGDKAQARDAETKAAIQKYLDVEDEVLEVSLEWIQYDNLKIEEDGYDILRNYLIDMKLSENPPTYEEFVDSSFIQ